MNRSILTLIAVLFSTTIFSQELAVQGIARDLNGVVRDNESLTLVFDLYYLDETNNPISIYTTTESLQTDAFGVFSTTLGLTAGTESQISNEEAYLEISEGSTVISNEKLKSVPYASSALNGVPTGSIMPYLGTTAPQGWLLCDGSSIPVTNETSALRELLGTASTPNLQGMFLRGTGQSPVNSQSGPSLMSTQDDAIESHQHGAGSLETTEAGEHQHSMTFMTDYTTGSGSSVKAFNSSSNYDGNVTQNTGSAGKHKHTVTGNTASTGGTETRPVNYGVNYIIKL